MSGKTGKVGYRPSDAYVVIMRELATGPKTRKYLTEKAAKYVPFERALRKAEYDRTRMSRHRGHDAKPPPRTRNRTWEEQIYYGRRAIVNQVLQSALANDRIVIERVPHLPGQIGRPNDIVRLRTDDDPSNPRNIRRRQTQKRIRERHKLASESEEAAGDTGTQGRSAA